MFKNVLLKLSRRKARFRDWFVGFAKQKNAEMWLAFFSFVESSFFPLPPDILLIALLLADRSRWVYRAALTTISSVIGGILGYVIGVFFFEIIGEPIISFYNLQEEVRHVGVLFSENTFWTVFAAAFTPIPYKVFTISAGFFSLHLATFITASLLGRGLRFFAVSFLTYRYGYVIRPILYKYFNAFTILFVLLIAVFFAAIK